MKIFNTILKIGVIAVILVSLAGCFESPDSLILNKIPAGMGSVQINIEGNEKVTGERTIFPVLSGVTYEITAELVGGSESLARNALFFNLPVGTWNITINVKNSASEIIGSAIIERVNVTESQTIVRTVILTPIGTGEGTLSWIMRTPPLSALDEFRLEYSDDDGETWNNLVDAGTGTFGAGEYDLPVGSYLVRSFLKGSIGEIGDIEAVHIYAGLTTVVNWQYRASLLIPFKPVTGIVEFNFGTPVTGITITIDKVTMTLTGDGGMDPQTALEFTRRGATDVWEVLTDIPETTTKLGGSLSIVTASNASGATQAPPIVVTFDDISYATGDIKLTDIAIRGVLVQITNGGDGRRLLVNGISLNHNNRIDFLAGDTVTLFPVYPDSGVEVESLSWGAVDYTNPVVINENTIATLNFRTDPEAINPNIFFNWSETVNPWPGLLQSDNSKTIGDLFKDEPTDPDLPFNDVGIAVFGGNHAPAATGIRLGNVRLSIGQSMGNGNGGLWTANDTFLNDRGGQFDLSSRPFRVSIGYSDMSGGVGNWWRFNLRNTSTSNGTGLYQFFAEHAPLATTFTFPTTSVEARTGITYRYLAGSNAAAGTLILDINPIAAYANDPNYHTLEKASFIIAAQNGFNVTITGIKLEYTDAAGPLTGLRLYNTVATTAAQTETAITAGAVMPASVRLAEGQELSLAAKAIPASASGTVVWASVNPSIATVANGVVTAGTTAGKTVISASIGSIRTEVEVDVFALVANDINIGGGSGTTLGGSKNARTLTLDLTGDPTVTANLTGTILPLGSPGTIYWDLEDNDDNISLSSSTGTAITITATKETVGDNPVIINVRLIEGGAILDKLEVTVNDSGGGGDVDPNLIFEWVYGTGSGPGGALTTGNVAYLAGTGTHPQAGNMPIRITHANVSYSSGQGIILDGSINNSGSALLVGTTTNGASSAGTAAEVATTQPVGVFNFRAGNTNGIRITLGMEILEDGVNVNANRGFNVIINNSTTTAGNTPLSGSGNEGRITLWNVPNAAGTGITQSGVSYNATTKILSCAVFTPSTFLQTHIQTLETAFIGISTLGRSASNAPPLENIGAKILITSIRIEYVVP